jgi:diadenosine tetraphosphate (Ap4A) HIT family hydrolase
MRERDKFCPYCAGGQEFPYGTPICQLSMSDVYLFHEQSKPGRCILGCREHVNDITDLTDEERNAFFADLAVVSRAIQNLYHPDKVNYGSYYDTGKHLHIHIVPKYEGEDEWGGVFTMNPGKVIWPPEVCAVKAAELKAEIERLIK